MLAELDVIEIGGWLTYLDIKDEWERSQIARAIVIAYGKED